MNECLFRAKEKTEPSRWQYGYYVRRTMNCPSPLDVDQTLRFDEYLIIEQMNDWGLPYTLYKCEIKPETVGRYLGATDKNGKRIFEGDIVRFRFDGATLYAVCGGTRPENIHERKGVIEWEENMCAFVIRSKSGGFIPFGNINVSWRNGNSTEIEVLGNIHENPELLENGDKEE